MTHQFFITWKLIITPFWNTVMIISSLYSVELSLHYKIQQTYDLNCITWSVFLSTWECLHLSIATFLKPIQHITFTLFRSGILQQMIPIFVNPFEVLEGDGLEDDIPELRRILATDYSLPVVKFTQKERMNWKFRYGGSKWEIFCRQWFSTLSILILFILTIYIYI